MQVNLTPENLLLPGGEDCLRLDKWLFSESSGFVLEATPGQEEPLLELLTRYGLQPLKLGEVSPQPILEITVDGAPALRVDLASLREAWLGGLAKVLR